MITSDHITFYGDTAWMVEWPAPDSPSGWPVNRNDRPCDTCHGEGDLDGTHDCPDCENGRHVFDIEVVAPFRSPYEEDEPTIYRVSVVEVMGPIDLVSPCVWTVRSNVHVGNLSPLPPAAEPGMWVVKLAVVQR